MIEIKVGLDTTEFDKQIKEVSKKLLGEDSKNKFRIVSKDAYMIEMLGTLMNKEEVEKKWEAVSKGYNFILSKYINGSTYYYSVEYIDEMLGK